MSFIEFDKSVKDYEWLMQDFHSHSHYELFFLLKGNRSFFLKDKMFSISAPCLIVIPPYTMHRTEGSGFKRININVSPDFLSAYEKQVLKKGDNITPLSITDGKPLEKLLEEGCEVFSGGEKNKTDILKILFGYIVYNIDKLEPASPEVYTAHTEKVPAVVLKILEYLSHNFMSEISLTALSEKFFTSKASICANFKKTMNCTVNEYLTTLRLNKAKQLLATSDKSLEKIAEISGFSSAMYMGLVFRKKVGLSPLGYRKLEKSKV